MALVVETTSTATSNNSASVVVTKPASVTAGDLLLILVGGGGGAGVGESVTFTCTGFSSAFSSQYDPGGGTSLSALGVLYRIADASDEAASNYTVSTSVRFTGAVTMMRISGWVTGNPVYSSASGGLYQDGTVTVAESVSIPRLGHQILLMFGNTLTSFGDGGTFSFGSYQVTSSDSNPTWTEIQDASYIIESSGIDGRFFCAYAITPNTSTITQYGFVKTGDSLAGPETTAYALACVFSPISVTASNALHQTSPVTFATLTGSTQTVSNSLHEVTPELQTQSAQYSQTTAWTAETKPSTTWESET